MARNLMKTHFIGFVFQKTFHRTDVFYTISRLFFWLGFRLLCARFAVDYSAVHFGFFRPEYSGSPLEVHGQLISVGIFRHKFAVSFLTNRFIVLTREIGKGFKNGKSNFYWLARFNRKMSYYFPRVLFLNGRFGTMESTRFFDLVLRQSIENYFIQKNQATNTMTAYCILLHVRLHVPLPFLFTKGFCCETCQRQHQNLPL